MERAITILREGYDAFNRGDFDAATAFLHPEVEWERAGDVGPSLRGRDAVREWMEPEAFTRQQNEIREITVHGDKVLVYADFHGVGAGSGIELTQSGYQLWTIGDGLAVKVQIFFDRDEALAAARE